MVGSLGFVYQQEEVQVLNEDIQQQLPLLGLLHRILTGVIIAKSIIDFYSSTLK